MSDSSLPLYHEDMFACYPKMIERLKKLVENGKAYTLSPFVQATPLAVRYANGFGYFSRRYVTTVATCADND